MRQRWVLSSVLVVGLLAASSCSTSGLGGGGGGGTCEAYTTDVFPPGPGPTRPAPTLLSTATSDLRLETPSAVYPYYPPESMPVVSPDGSKLLYYTGDKTVVPGGFAGDFALILHDRTTGSNTLIMSQLQQRAVTGVWRGQFLPDGSVAFVDTGLSHPIPADQFSVIDTTQIFRWDVNTHAYSVLSLGFDGQPIPQGPGNGPFDPRVSADGRYLFFRSSHQIDPGEAYNGLPGVGNLWRRDLVTGEIQMVNVGNHPELGINANESESEVEGWDISADGRYVVFGSRPWHGLSEWGTCGDGVVVFLRDLDAGTTTLVSRDAITGKMRLGAGPRISADGRFVTYTSMTPSFVPLPNNTEMIWDRVTGQNDWLLPARNGSPMVQMDVKWISPDGNRMLVSVNDDSTVWPNALPGDGDLHSELAIYDRAANTIQKVSQLPDGSNPWSGAPFVGATLSADGSRLYFATSNPLLPADTDSTADVYSMAVN
jgi:Tol biopolymer transport system component